MKNQFRIRFGGLGLILCLWALPACQTWKQPKAPQLSPPPPPSGKGLSPAGAALYHFSVSKLKEREADQGGAMDEIRQALSADPASAYLHLQLANLLFQNNKLAEAEAEAKTARQLNPSWSEASNFLAVIYLNTNRPKEAQALLEQTLAQDPDNEDAHLHLTMAYLNQGFPGPAVETMRAYLQKHPNSANGHYFLGQIFFKLDQFPKAIAEYEEALRIQPELYFALQELAQSYMLTRQKDAGIETYTRILSFYPGDSDSRSVLATTLIEVERWDQARAVLAQGKVEDDKREEWWLQTGYIDMRLKDYQAAQTEFTELLARNPKNDAAVYYLGVLAQLQNRPAEARSWYEKIPKESSRYPDARRRIAWSFEEEGNRDQALQALKELNREMPKAVPFYLDRAALYQKSGQFDLALGVLMEGIENNPGDEELIYQVGTTYDLMGDHDLAVDQMQKILSQNPKSARALNFIGYSYADRGLRLDEAEKMIRQALEQEPDNGAILDSLGWVYYQRKQYPEALKWLKQAIEKMPEDPEIVTHLGDIYFAQGQKKRALEFYQKALSSLKDNPRPGLDEKIKTKIEKTKRK